MSNIRHVFTSPQADATGTLTIWNGATTATVAATAIVRPGDWNASHVGGLDLAASNTTYTSGTVVLSGGANVTVGTNGQTVTFAAASQTVQTQNMVALSASNSLFSSGTVVISGFGAATVNTAAGTIRISVPVQSVQPETQTFVGGVAVNALTTYTSGTVVLSGGNNITLSQNGQSITISGANAGGAQTAISGLANSQTTYTSGTVSLSELGAITIRSTTGNQYQFSVAAQSVQTQNMVALSASNALFSSGTVVISGFGAVTVNTAAGTIRISSPVQTAQTGISSIVASDATYTSGSVQFTGSGIVTVKSSANQRVVIDASQSVQTQNMLAATLSGNSTSAGAGFILMSSGTMVLAGGNNITLSQNGQSVTISGAAAGGAQTAISGLANSETTYTSGSVTLSALGAITIRSTTGQHYQFSVAAQTVQTQNMVALSASDNLYSSGTIVISGGANVTVGTNGQTITISAANGGGGAATQSFWPSMPTGVATAPLPNATTEFSGAGGNSSSYLFPLFIPYPISFDFVRLPYIASTNSTSVATSANTTVSNSINSTINLAIFDQQSGASSLSLSHVMSTSASMAWRWSIGENNLGSVWTMSFQASYPMSTTGQATYSTNWATSQTRFDYSTQSLTLFTGGRFLDLQWQGSLPAGNYWMAIGVSHTATHQVAGLSRAVRASFQSNFLGMSAINSAFGEQGVQTNNSVMPFGPLGNYTVAGGATTASLNMTNVTSQASHFQQLVQFHRTA